MVKRRKINAVERFEHGEPFSLWHDRKVPLYSGSPLQPAKAPAPRAILSKLLWLAVICSALVNIVLITSGAIPPQKFTTKVDKVTVNDILHEVLGLMLLQM